MKFGRHLDETPTDKFVQLTSIIINFVIVIAIVIVLYFFQFTSIIIIIIIIISIITIITMVIVFIFVIVIIINAIRVYIRKPIFKVRIYEIGLKCIKRVVYLQLKYRYLSDKRLGAWTKWPLYCLLGFRYLYWNRGEEFNKARTLFLPGNGDVDQIFIMTSGLIYTRQLIRMTFQQGPFTNMV